MKKNILSEINRVREIMGVINEQKIKTVVGKEIVEGPMTKELNRLIREKESELLKDWKFYVSSSPNKDPEKNDNIFLQIKNRVTGEGLGKYLFKKGKKGLEVNMFPIAIPVSIGGAGLYTELVKNRDFNYFFKTNTEAAKLLKKQINNLKVRVEVYPSTQGRPGSIYLEFLKNSKKNRKSGKTFSFDEGLPLNTLLPISTGDGGNSAQLNGGKVLLLLSAGDIQSDLKWLSLRAPVIQTEPEIPDVFARDIVFKLQVTDPFEFDSPDITENAKNEIKAGLDRLLEDLNDENVYEQYINTKIKGKDIIVNAYSSIDAKSDEVGGGSVSECSPGGTTTRAQYNLCLSQKRAETIVNYLKSEFPEIFGETNLIAKGMGELESPNSVNEPYRLKATDEHIKKYPKLQLKLGQLFRNPPQLKHSNENRVATASDRKFVINMPEFTTTKFD